MTRFTVILIIAVVLGLLLGVNIWFLAGILASPDEIAATSVPETFVSGNTPSLVDTDAGIAVHSGHEAIRKPRQPSESEKRPLAAPEQDEITADSPTPVPGKQVQQDQPDSALLVTAPIKGKPESDPIQESAPKQMPRITYPLDVQGWKVWPYKTGCVATLAVKGGSSLIDPFKPERLAMYVYHETDPGSEMAVPAWFGYVAPGRGEMSARLISPQGEVIRGVTGSTGLSWDKLAANAQRDMELKLTQCDLTGECVTHDALVDLTALNAASLQAYRCANALDSNR